MFLKFYHPRLKPFLISSKYISANHCIDQIFFWPPITCVVEAIRPQSIPKQDSTLWKTTPLITMQRPYPGHSCRELCGSCEKAKHLGLGSAWRFAERVPR